MKPPLGEHPTLLLVLWGTVVVLWLVALRVVGYPFAPSSPLAVAAGLLAGLWLSLAVQFDEQTGGDQYLRRRLAGKRFYHGRYWWLRWIALAQAIVAYLLVAQHNAHDLHWLFFGFILGQLAGYPYWRARWQRLEALARQEQADVAPSPGAAG